MTRLDTFTATAAEVAYTLGEPPDQTDWAVANVYDDGEIRYQDSWDEAEARRDAQTTTLDAMANPERSTGSLPVRAFPAYRETRVLADGTQIISPWIRPVHDTAEKG